MNREDQIIEYLEGNLSKSEAIAFEAKIAADEELKNDVELFKKVIQGIENEGAEELKEYLQKRLNEPEIRTNSRAWMYAAASVSILLLGYVAIFKYTQTGSIQKTTDYITLKDKSMNRLKFWKKSNQSDASESSIIKEKRSPYLDSIKMLEEAELIAVNKDKDYIISPEEEPVSESLIDEKNIPVQNLTSNRLSNDESMDTDTVIFYETLIASINVKPINLKLESSSLVKEIEREAIEQTTNSVLSSKVQKESKVRASSVEKNKLKETNSPTKDVLDKTKKSDFNKIESVTIDLFKTDENKQMIIETWGPKLKLKLINISGENPLIYRIDNYYYLQIQRDIYQLKGFNNMNVSPEVIKDENLKRTILIDE